MRRFALNTPGHRCLASLLLLGAIVWAPSVGAAEAQAALPPPRTIREIFAAPVELLATNPAIETKAVVTFVEPSAALLFVHDGTAGIFVHTAVDLSKLVSGTALTIKGHAQSGRYSPIIVGTSLEAGGVTNLPAAQPASVGRIQSGAEDGQWVELSGVVRWDGRAWLHRVLQLHDGERFVRVRIKDQEPSTLPNLTDARVKVRGVGAGFYEGTGKATDVTLYVPSLREVEVVEAPAGDPFSAPLVSIARLGNWPGAGRQEHLLRVRGVVTFQMPGHWLALRDGDQPLVVENSQTNRVAVGREIEVAGFPSTTGRSPRLTQAQWRETDRQLSVAPRKINSPAELSECLPGERVQFRARLTSTVAPRSGRAEAMVQLGSSAVAVSVSEVAGALPWQIGAEYEFTGACLPDVAGGGLERSINRVWLANSEAAVLVGLPAAAPGPGFMIRDLLWLLLFATAATGWWWQHRRQKTILDEMEATLAFNRAQLVRAESEQARIARDLHDGVIQSIYAVGMRIEECRRLTATSSANASEKLAITSEVLNHVIRDVRGFLTGLEPASIQGRELKTALKSVLLGLGDEAADRIALEIDSSTAAALPSREATELFHICKEALSNSLRHGRATRIAISLKQTEQGCRVAIVDNGCGYEPAMVPGESRGLQNIRSRARNLGAQLQVITGPDAGTQLVIVLPKA